RIFLDDGAWLFDISGDELGYTYRLYAAAFARTPDEAGLRWWLNNLESGALPREDAAGYFIQSEEFIETYGAAQSNSDYLTALYFNTLLRAPEQRGFDWWLERLDEGLVDRAAILAEFAESVENVNRTEPFLEDGVWVIGAEDLFG
ncbi:MAG: DUF4214 domain-containing protein, partial [Pseudomonadota bacterium]